MTFNLSPCYSILHAELRYGH